VTTFHHPGQAGLTPDEQQATIKRSFGRILPIMFVASVIAYMDRANLGFAQLGMGVELGITAATYGAIAAAFFISYFIFEIPSNMLLERFGARRWIARIMLSWGLVTILTGFVNSVPTLYIARVMLGIAEAGFFPGMVLYLALWFPARQRAVALAGVS